MSFDPNKIKWSRIEQHFPALEKYSKTHLVFQVAIITVYYPFPLCEKGNGVWIVSVCLVDCKSAKFEQLVGLWCAKTWTGDAFTTSQWLRAFPQVRRRASISFPCHLAPCVILDGLFLGSIAPQRDATGRQVTVVHMHNQRFDAIPMLSIYGCGRYSYETGSTFAWKGFSATSLSMF
jgi:hypothetical protein